MSVTRVRWEYSYITKQTENYLVGDLNDAGKAGWEVVSVHYFKDLKGIWNWTAFLKRPCGEATEEGGMMHLADGGALHAPAGRPDPSQSGRPDQSPADAGGFDLSDSEFNFKD